MTSDGVSFPSSTPDSCCIVFDQCRDDIFFYFLSSAHISVEMSSFAITSHLRRIYCQINLPTFSLDVDCEYPEIIIQRVISPSINIPSPLVITTACIKAYYPLYTPTVVLFTPSPESWIIIIITAPSLERPYRWIHCS